jgi:hypothetical protein
VKRVAARTSGVFLSPAHAQEHQTKLSPICQIADDLKPSIPEPVSLIDNQQLDQTGEAACHQKVFRALMALIGGLYQIRKGCESSVSTSFSMRETEAETGGVENTVRHSWREPSRGAEAKVNGL